MLKKIDCRGLACPEPAIKVSSELKKDKESEKMVVLLSSVTARDNVIRIAQKMGWTIEKAENEEGCHLHLTRHKL